MLQLTADEYQVGWVCALPCEYAAAKAMLDEQHQMVKGQDRADSNSYTLGRVHNHNVVVACLPAGVDGTNAAAVVATNLSRTFRCIRFGLMVGIGGGIPHILKGIDIRLGDIVVSRPSGTNGGVVQYDKGKSHDDWQFVRKGQLNRPPTVLLTALSNLQAEHEMRDSQIREYLDQMLVGRPKMQKLGYSFPSQETDILWCTHTPLANPSCDRCKDRRVKRESRESVDPLIHYGVIASGNQVIKNAEHRDRLREMCEDAICVETEAAGLMDNFPCLVIRGICDYADSTKNDRWHNYAAATAAAFAKELLLYVSAEQTSHEQPIREIIGQIDSTLKENVEVSKEALEESRVQFEKLETQKQTQRERDCLQAFKTSPYERYKNINQDRVPGTCHWVLDHPHFQRWYNNSHNDLLWISADPGCGKSVLSRSLIQHELAALQTTTTCYYFFKDNERQDRLAPALCAVLHQLFSEQPHLLKHAVPEWEKNGVEIQEEVEILWRILLDAASDKMAEPVVCVLDALDELCDGDRRELVTRLCHFHEQLPKMESRAATKFLATSRPYDNVQRWFEQTTSRLPQVRLRGEFENDCIQDEINLVIDQRIKSLAEEFSLSKPDQDKLRQQLKNMKHRTYLWLHLAMEEIRTNYLDSPDPREALIHELPTSVEDAYEKILQRITNRQRFQARRILLIVVGSRRPLTIPEVAMASNAATAYEMDHSVIKQPNVAHLGSRVREWCGLFVFINHSQLFLIHQTAKEFLLSNLTYQDVETRLWKGSLPTAEVERVMAVMCVTYLSLGVEAQQSTSQASHDINVESNFFEYCAEHWTSHLSDHDIMEHQKLLEYVLELYKTTGERFASWFPIMWKASKLRLPVPRIHDQHVIAMNGHAVVLLERYERQKFDLDQVDGTGSTALKWASGQGHQEVVQILLDMGASPNPEARGPVDSALKAASANGHVTIVRMLLDNGADVNAHLEGWQDALQAASASGHVTIVEILLDKGAHVSTRGGVYGSAIQAAASNGHEKIVEMLLGKDADVDLQDGLFGTALYEAQKGGHEKIAKMLIARDAKAKPPQKRKWRRITHKPQTDSDNTLYFIESSSSNIE